MHLEVVLFLTLEVVLFLTLVWLYVFPYLARIDPFFLTPKTIIDMQAGQSVVLFLTLADLGVHFLDNITCFLGLFVFCFLVLFFSFFCSSHTLLCYVSNVPTNKESKS